MAEWFIWTIIIILTGLCTLALALMVAKKKVDPESNGARQPKRISEPIIQCVTVIAIAVTFYYLMWRLTTLNPEAMILSWLLWIAEAYGFVVFFFFVFMAWRPGYPVPPQGKA